MTDPPSRKVLLIGWDAADWKVITPLLDAGKMPNLERLINEGVMGNLSTLYPSLSPTLWTSIATGKRPFNHGYQRAVAPLKHIYLTQVARVKKLLTTRKIPTLYVRHRECIRESATVAARINEFLGGGLDEAAMAGSVAPRLYRQTAG